MAVMTSGSDNIAVSNLYSTVSLEEGNESVVIIEARFQLTWMFPRHTIPTVRLTSCLASRSPICHVTITRLCPVSKLKKVWATIGGAWTTTSDLILSRGRFEPLNFATAKITTIPRTMKPLSGLAKPSAFLDVYCLLKTRPRRPLVPSMSSSGTSRTIGVLQPEKTVNSVWTCSFHRFAQAVLTCD